MPTENNFSIGCCESWRGSCRVLPPFSVEILQTVFRRVLSKPGTASNIPRIIMVPAQTYTYYINTQSNTNRSLAALFFQLKWFMSRRMAWQECADHSVLRCLSLELHWVNNCAERGKTDWMNAGTKGWMKEWVNKWMNDISPVRCHSYLATHLFVARYSAVNWYNQTTKLPNHSVQKHAHSDCYLKPGCVCH